MKPLPWSQLNLTVCNLVVMSQWEPIGAPVHLLTCDLGANRIGIVNEGKKPTYKTVAAP
jgi:hypothetical protein